MPSEMDTANSATWRKSTYSGGSGSECVEAGVAGHGHVLVRDTKDHGGGPVLRLPPRAFADFTTRIRKDPAL